MVILYRLLILLFSDKNVLILQKAFLSITAITYVGKKQTSDIDIKTVMFLFIDDELQ